MPNSTFNLRELVSLIVLSIFIIALSVPTGEAAGRSSRRMQNSSQLRGIHQGLVTYANSNKNWFAGIDSSGSDEGVWVEQRYQLLLEGEYFTPEYALSPYESDPTIYAWPGSGVVIQHNYSFAMLQLPATGARRSEWSQSLNSQAIVVADRNTGTKSSTYGYHNDQWTSKTTFGCTHSRRQPYINANHWVGNVLWNDNHVAFEPTDTLSTKYGPVANASDNLFNATGTDDALLIHTGN